MTSVVYYEGERIYFRPVELDDEPLLRRWVNDPRVWSTLNFRPPINAVNERKWIEDRKLDPLDYHFGIVARDGERLIGVCGLHRVDPVSRKATFGIMIGDVESQNSGYGTDATRLTLRFAFEELNLNRVELCVFDSNPRAIRVYEKAGFEYEGRARQAIYRHGRYCDELHYAVLRERWFEARGQTTRPAVSEVLDG